MKFQSWKNWLMALAALCGLPQAAHAQLERYNPHFDLQLRLADSTLTRARNFCDTIPIEVEDNQIFINVSMDGQQRRFLLDTGSSQGMVFQASAIDGLNLLGNIVSRDANYHVDTVSVVQLPPFSMGLPFYMVPAFRKWSA